MLRIADKFKQFGEKHPALCEIMRFLIVGGFATLVDMFIMGVVLYAFKSHLTSRNFGSLGEYRI